MAFASASDHDALMQGLASGDEKLSRPALQKLEKTLERIRADRFEICADEMMTGVNTLAAPIFRDDNILAGVIAIIESVDSITEAPKPGQLTSLHAAAADLSGLLHSTAYVNWA
jgi:IclR family KDG regulon transcriptional repressor